MLALFVFVVRWRRDAARKLLANGVDPSENRKAQKTARADGIANSFEVVAREWFAKYSSTWVERHRERILSRFERDMFPWIGARPIADITAPEVLTTVRRIEERGALGTAHRTLSNCGQVFRYAIATGRAKHDPSGDLRGHSHRRQCSISQLRPSRYGLQRFCEQWTATKVLSPCALPCVLPRCYSSALASCARQNGQTSILAVRSGVLQ